MKPPFGAKLFWASSREWVILPLAYPMPIVKTVYLLNGKILRYQSSANVTGVGRTQERASANHRRILADMAAHGVQMVSPREPESWMVEAEGGRRWHCGFRDRVELRRTPGTSPVIHPSLAPAAPDVEGETTFIGYGLSLGLGLERVLDVLHGVDPFGTFLTRAAIVGQMEQSDVAVRALHAAASRTARP
jgi:hypothetical protein